jgi:hypothetical protein
MFQYNSHMYRSLAIIAIIKPEMISQTRHMSSQEPSADDTGKRDNVEDAGSVASADDTGKRDNVEDAGSVATAEDTSNKDLEPDASNREKADGSVREFLRQPPVLCLVAFRQK